MNVSADLLHVLNEHLDVSSVTTKASGKGACMSLLMLQQATLCMPSSPLPASMSCVAISTMSTDLPKGLVPMDRPWALPNEAGQLEPLQPSILFSAGTLDGMFIC